MVAVSVILYVLSGLMIIAAIILTAVGAMGAAVASTPLSSYGIRVATASIGGAVLFAAMTVIDIALAIFLRKGRTGRGLSRLFYL